MSNVGHGPGALAQDGAEMGERETHAHKDAVVSVTAAVSLQKKNLRLFLAVLYLKPLQNVRKKRCKTQDTGLDKSLIKPQLIPL